MPLSYLSSVNNARLRPCCKKKKFKCRRRRQKKAGSTSEYLFTSCKNLLFVHTIYLTQYRVDRKWPQVTTIIVAMNNSGRGTFRVFSTREFVSYAVINAKSHTSKDQQKKKTVDSSFARQKTRNLLFTYTWEMRRAIF